MKSSQQSKRQYFTDFFSRRLLKLC